MNCSTPGSCVLHYLPEFTQIHVHWVPDAIQPSLPLSSLSPPAFKLSQHHGLFQWPSFSHQVTKVLELQHQSFQWILRMVCMCTLSCFSCIGLFSTLQALDPQAPLSMGILQARILEWVAFSFSRGSSQTRGQIRISCTAGGFFATEPPVKLSNIKVSHEKETNSYHLKTQHVGLLWCSSLSCLSSIADFNSDLFSPIHISSFLWISLTSYFLDSEY